MDGQRIYHPLAASDFVTLDLMEKRETIALDCRTQQRLYVLNHVLAGELTAEAAGRKPSVRDVLSTARSRSQATSSRLPAARILEHRDADRT